MRTPAAVAAVCVTQDTSLQVLGVASRPYREAVIRYAIVDAGQSAKSLDRPGLQRALGMLRKHDAVRKLPDLGALSTAERITWAAAEIAKQREECPIPERVENWISLSDSTIHWKRWLVEILLGAHQLYQVRFTGEGPLGIVARGPCRTVKGGLRLGVAAARRAWRLGVGR